MKRRWCAGLFGALVLLAGCSSGSSDDADEPGPQGTTASPGRTPPPASGRWQPKPGTRWQWQLDGTVDTSVDVPVYDIDGFENSAKIVAELHAHGRKVICYVNVGAWEDFRPDHGEFPKAVLGKKNKGWKGEKWLDIRRLDVLRPLMAARMDMCREKGFDAVEPDLTEGFRNGTGFPLTAADQLAFNKMIAKLAHDRGLAVGLKKTTWNRFRNWCTTSTSPSTSSARSTRSATGSRRSCRGTKRSFTSNTIWIRGGVLLHRQAAGAQLDEETPRSGRLASAVLNAPRGIGDSTPHIPCATRD
ncbi:hypothetical protein GCM10020000_72120 [Streptomyces olivoverticillatus]